MSMNVSEIIRQVAERLDDNDSVTYTEEQIVAWLDEAQNAICRVRPDAYTITVPFKLAQGAKQTLPSEYRGVANVHRNLGTDAATVGRVVYGPTELNRWGRYNPDWSAASNQTAVVKEYAYNLESPYEFWVNPPADATGNYLEITVKASPPSVDSASDVFGLSDEYIGPALEWVLYCLWDRGTQRNEGQSNSHYTKFMDLLGTKTQADAASKPQNTEAGG